MKNKLLPKANEQIGSNTQDLRKTSMLDEAQGTEPASSGAYQRVNEQRSGFSNAAIRQQATFCVSPDTYSVNSISSDYKKIPMHPILRPYVDQLTIQQFHLTEINTVPYIVLPSTSIVMGFQYQGHLHQLRPEGHHLLDRSGISGLQTACRLFQNNLYTRTILVSFKPWSIPIFFRESAQTLANNAVGLSSILRSSIITTLEDQLNTTTDCSVLAALVQNFLIEQLLKIKHKTIPANFIAAVNSMTANLNIQSIAMIAKNYGFSERTLERKFKTIIGVSPKKFSSITRFQKAMAALRNTRSWEEVGYKFGYYDQSHFIHEFKQFANVTPKQFIKSIL